MSNQSSDSYDMANVKGGPPHFRKKFIGRTREIRTIRELLTGEGYAGVLVSGESGIGKTELLKESVKGLEVKGRVIWVSAARPNLRLPRTGKRYIVVVDDAHQLDSVAASWVHKLAIQENIRVLISVQAEVEVDSAITSLWVNGLVARIEVGPLRPQHSRELVRVFMSGAISTDDAIDLSYLSSGNPALLLELASGYAQDCVSFAADGLQVVHGNRLIRLDIDAATACASLIHRLTPPVRRILQMVALAGRLPVEILDRLTDAQTLVELEEGGYVCVKRVAGKSEAGGHHDVQMSSPLLAGFSLLEISEQQAEEHFRTLISVIAARDTEFLESIGIARVTKWRLAAGEFISQRELLSAVGAVLKEGDLRQAIQFSKAAWNFHRSIEAAIMYASAASVAGDFIRAEAVLDRAHFLHPDSIKAIACAHARLAISKGVARNVESIVGSNIHDSEVRLCLALSEYAQGEFYQTLQITTRLMRNHMPGRRLEVAAVHMAALSHIGRPVEALNVWDQINRSNADGFKPVPLPHVTLEEGYAAALLYAGRGVEAVPILEDLHSQAAAVGNVDAEVRWGWALCLQLLDLGKPDRVVDVLSSLHSGIDEKPVLGRNVELLTLHAQAYVSATTKQDSEASSRERYSPFYANHQIARAWIAWSLGNQSSAMEFLTTAVTVAEERGCYGDVALIVHEMARMRIQPDDDERFLSVPVEGSLLNAKLAYAAAVFQKSAVGMESVAISFAEMGYHLYTAEAFAELSRIYRMTGDARSATAAALRSQEFAAQCEGVNTLSLQSLQIVDDLSGREQQIAQLAASGYTDKEIAKFLSISIRTVGNHLYRIYKKLGILSRRELAFHFPQGDQNSVI
ncbi:LuxR C-terminal-related transcriptional regulator [Streptomyces sp. NPDC060085]|uniref:LuxR C-terminal-related transcriptional regulator n=1 Tax=Streptomyces sp. NPDC060085 TaxID=3347054 RepID=UPI00366A02C2